MSLTPTSLAASLAKWSGVRPQGAHESLRKPENLTQKCTKLICMGTLWNTLNFQIVLRLSRLTCQETPHNSSRSRGSGHFRPWHRQLRDFAAAAGRTFRHPGRRHCGAPSGLGDKRRSHLNCTTTSCLLHPATLLHYTTEETSNVAKAWQKGGNGNLLCWQHIRPFSSLLFDLGSTLSPRPNLFFFSTFLPSSDVMSWPWHDQGKTAFHGFPFSQTAPKNSPSA